jgi:hypothetical protein
MAQIIDREGKMAWDAGAEAVFMPTKQRVRGDGFLLTVRAEVTRPNKIFEKRYRRTELELKEHGKQTRPDITPEEAEANKIRARIYKTLSLYAINLGTLGYYVLAENRMAAEAAFSEMVRVADTYNKSAAYAKHSFRIRFSYLMVPAPAEFMQGPFSDMVVETLSSLYELLRGGYADKALRTIKLGEDLPLAYTPEGHKLLSDVLRRASSDADHLRSSPDAVRVGKGLDLDYLTNAEQMFGGGE